MPTRDLPPSTLIPQFGCRLPSTTQRDIKTLKKQLKLSSQGLVIVKAVKALKAQVASKARAKA